MQPGTATPVDARPKVADIAHRRKRVAEAYLRGVPQFIIAQGEHVHKSTITRDLDAIREEWKASASMAFGERVAQELAKLDELERTYWDAWERSCKDAETLTAKTVTDGTVVDGKPIPSRTEAVKRVEGRQPGDPRFLEGVERCIKKRTEILGLNAPLKIRHGGDDKAPPVKVKWENAIANLPDDQLLQLKGIADAVRSAVVDADAGETPAGPGAVEAGTVGAGTVPA